MENANLNFSLILSKSLEAERNNLEQAFRDAQIIVYEFANRFGWQAHLSESFIDEAQIYDTKQAFDNRLRESFNMEASAVIPSTYSAILEEKILMSVSPKLLSENYPDGIEDNHFAKLIAHEIAHRLHVRILNGNEDAMGPIWFFEGFAVYASDQFHNTLPTITDSKLIEIINSKERGSYKLYGAVFHRLAISCLVPEMIARAADENFIDWLTSVVKKT